MLLDQCLFIIKPDLRRVRKAAGVRTDHTSADAAVGPKWHCDEMLTTLYSFDRPASAKESV